VVSRARLAWLSRAWKLAGIVALVVVAPGACFDFGGYSLVPAESEPEDAGEEDASIAPCAPPTPEGACGTIPHCGCEQGLVCDVVDFSGRSACVQDKELAVGAACAGLFQGCGAGLTCVDGACKKFCIKGRPCSSEGLCFQVMHQADAGAIGIDGMKVCTEQCNYMNPDAVCGAGTACYPHGDADSGYSECATAGTSVTGCEINENCAAGLACGEDKRCHPWCRQKAPLDCPPGQLCNAVKGGAYYYLGDVAYGVCK
jgi:hypothetical protein